MNTTIEETQDTSTQQGPAAAPEIDFDRVLAGDEAYTEEANKQLAAEAPQSAEEEAEKPADEKPEEAKSEEAAKPTLDPDEVVETITYRGQEVPVKRSQMKDLLQKGRHLEVRLGEVAPILALAREVPELNEKLRTPEGRKEIVERIRQQQKAREAGEELPEVEGYDKADVQAVDKILQARMKALGITPPEQGNRPTPAQIEAMERDRADMVAKTRITLESLQSVDPHYEENMVLLKEVVAEIERTAPPEKFREFYAAVNDPRVIDPSTGRPAFLNFYADIDRERQRRVSGSAGATVPTVPDVPAARKVHVPSSRMAPGSATPPSAGTSGNLLKFNSQDEFNRAFDEALSRG